MAFCYTIHPPALKKGQASVGYRSHQAEVHRGTLRLVIEQLLIQGRTECRENTKNDQVPKSSNSSAPTSGKFLERVLGRQDWSLEGEAVGSEPPKQPALGDPTGQRDTDPGLSPSPPCQWCSAYWWGQSSRGSTRQGPQGKPPGLRDPREGACSFIYNSLKL